MALVSGGLDSVVSLARAVADMEVRLVLFANYRQRALERERTAVLGVVSFYDLPFREVDLSWLGELSPEGMCVPERSAPAPTLDTLDAVWIPNRNGVLLNVAAAFAESYRCDYVIVGFNREEAAEFPDNSAEYATRASNALDLSTRNHVRVLSFTQGLDKRETIALGARLGAPLTVVWSCYHGGEVMCGRCASCRRLKAALAETDPGIRPPLEFDD